MKKFLFAASICVLALVSCNKEIVAPTPSQDTVTLSFRTSNKLDLASKTVLQADNSVVWSEEGESLKFFQIANGHTTVATSGESVVEGNQALFEVSFPTVKADSYTYYATYPASSWVTNDNYIVTKIKLTTPSTQNPSLSSFDGNADLLISKPVVVEEQTDGMLDLVFKRIIAAGKMTLTNLNCGADPVVSVKFIATGKSLTGRSYIDLTTGEVSEYGYQHEDYVLLNYASSVGFTSESTAYFTCFPASLTAGDSFTVIAETANTRFTKTVTIPEGRNLNFTAGGLSTFEVSMAGAAEESLFAFSGDYVIVVKHTSKNEFYALSCEVASSSRLASITLSDFTSSAPSYETENNNIIWTISKSGNDYNIQSKGNGKYITFGGSKGSAATQVSADSLSITENSGEKAGTYHIASVKYGTYLLSRNTSSEYFAFYESTQWDDLYIVPVAEDTRAALTAPANVMADVVIGTPNSIEVVWDTVTGAADYTVSISPADAAAQTVTGTNATFEGLKFETEYTVSIVANPSDPTANKPSAATTATATTGENPDGATSYTVKYTITSKTSVSTTGNAPSGSSATYTQTFSTVSQITSSNSATLTLRGYTGKTIKGLVLSMKSNSKKGAGTFSLKSGDNTLASINTATNFNAWYDRTDYSTSYVNVNVTLTNDNYVINDGEDVVITIAATINSLYIESYEITYE